jgi:hypothetical protein
MSAQNFELFSKAQLIQYVQILHKIKPINPDEVADGVCDTQDPAFIATAVECGVNISADDLGCVLEGDLLFEALMTVVNRSQVYDSGLLSIITGYGLEGEFKLSTEQRHALIHNVVTRHRDGLIKYEDAETDWMYAVACLAATHTESCDQRALVELIKLVLNCIEIPDEVCGVRGFVVPPCIKKGIDELMDTELSLLAAVKLKLSIES